MSERKETVERPFALSAMAAGVMFAFGSLTSASALAQEEEATELGTLQITGSRISRADVAGATPVLTIERTDIENSGFATVSDFLRSNAFNSFGSIRESSGNTAQGQAALALRGLGSNRTLILVNGRRLPGSPVQDGQSQNLNTLPLAAIERIEILSDGASAVYGSDAIGGVVNVILRRDYNGSEYSVWGTDPSKDGGDETRFNAVGGFQTNSGSRVTWSIESYTKDIIFSRDRTYLSNQFLGGDPNDANNYSEISLNGRNIWDPSTFDIRSMVQGAVGDPNCGIYGAGFIPQILGDPAFPADSYCNYDYTAVAAQTASLDRKSAYVNADYEIFDDWTANMTLLATRVESFGRYAPVASGLLTWNGPDLAARDVTVNGQTYTLAPMNNGDLYTYRFDQLGSPRDTTQVDYQYDAAFGIQGEMFGVDWSANYQYDIYDLQEWGNGYVTSLGLELPSQNGWDPRDPDQAQYADILSDIRENANRRAQMIMQRIDLGGQFAIGQMQMFVGGEYIDQKYFDEASAQNEAGNVRGTSGGSSGGNRTNWALFAEGLMPVSDFVEAGLALRYDSYSDFGSNVSGKASMRYQPTDFATIRASYGTGFRAPSLDELYQSPTFSASFGQDIVECSANNIDIADCPTRQYDTFYSANSNLDPEKSTQYLLGGVVDFNALADINLSASMDYYYTKVEDLITTLSNTSIYFAEFVGILDQLPGYSVDRAANGRAIETRAAAVNFGSLETSGLDIRVNYTLDLAEAGSVRFGSQINYLLTYDAQDYPGGPSVDQLGRNGTPKYRANTDISWTMGIHTVALNSYFIPGQDESLDFNENLDSSDPSTFFNTSTGSIDSYLHHNLVYALEVPWNGQVQFGINNLTDEEPVLDRFNQFDDQLYPIVSRSLMMSYTQRF